MARTIREVVAVFEIVEALDTAVYALETRGFDRAAFSLLAAEKTVEQKLGHRYQQIKDIKDEPGVPRATFFSRISRLEAEYLPAPALAAIGALVMIGVGSLVPVLVAAGAGGVLGAALGRMVQQKQAKRIQEQLASGGLLLWVNVRNQQDLAPAEHSDIFSDQTRRAIADTFNAIPDEPVAQAQAADRAAPLAPVNGLSEENVFERAVRESFEPVMQKYLSDNSAAVIDRMKPLIREWMDEHFPSLL